MAYIPSSYHDVVIMLVGGTKIYVCVCLKYQHVLVSALSVVLVRIAMISPVHLPLSLDVVCTMFSVYLNVVPALLRMRMSADCIDRAIPVMLG